MEVGRVDDHRQQEPHRIDDHVPLAALDLFEAVEAALVAPDRRRLDRLAIDHGRRRAGLAPELAAQFAAHEAQQAGNQASVAPLLEVVVDQAPGGKLTGQETLRRVPLRAAGLDEVEHRVEDLVAQVVLALTFVVEQVFDSFPLGVRHIGAIAARTFGGRHGFGRLVESGISQDADGLLLVGFFHSL